MSSRPTSFACIAALALTTGCGSGDSDRAAADAQLQQQIQESAAQHQRQIERAQEAQPLPEPVTDEEAATSPSAVDDLPAGTEELDSPATTSAASPSSSALFSSADRRSFARLARTLPGAEGIAVATLGTSPQVSRVGSLRSGVAWSTGKVPVAMAAKRASVGTNSDFIAAITASDNAAAERLWAALGGGQPAATKSTRQVRAAGDDHTSIQGKRIRAGFTAFGQTDWALTDQARFMAGMQCAAEGPSILQLMGKVVSGQRWGLGALDSSAQFKGGWGPGIRPGAAGGWLDRQMGIVRINGRPIAVAIATTAGSHESGTRALTALAKWTASHVGVKGAPRQASC